METMQLSFCHLCGESRDEASLTYILSERGKVEKLEFLIDQYIIPILRLPKNDKLCLCDTCKTRLQAWDAFIESCRKARERLKAGFEVQKNLLPVNGMQGIDSAATITNQNVSNVLKKKKSSNYCIARWCNKGNYQGVSLFRLPRDRDRALKWLSAAERKDLECMATLHSYYLCANHFSPNMFTNKAHNQLIKGAIPTLFPKSPYADRRPIKKATTQLHGVKFKSILPKASLSDNVQLLPPSKVQEPVKVTDKVNSEGRWSPFVLHVLPQMKMSQNQFSRAKGQGSSLCFVDSSKNQILYQVTDAKSSTPSDGKEGSNQGILVLQDIAPSDLSDEFSSRALPAVIGSSTEDINLSQKVKKDNSLICEPTYIVAHPKNSESQVEHNVSDSYESIVGSQDVLLPHVSKSRIPPTDSIEPTLMLRSTLSHAAPVEGNSILSNTNEINVPNIGLFDLRTDEIQGASHAAFSNMVNLDELMDLDHYFNR